MNRDAAIAIAKKLKALAEKSEGGERLSASKKLREFCIKHDLDDEEYSLEVVKAVIPFNNENERMLLSSVMCMVMEVDGVKGKVEDGKFIFQCTTRQFEDILEAFRHYKKIHEDYAEGAMLAIITRNDIKNRKVSSTNFKMEEMTEEERKEYDELMNRARQMENVPPPDQSGCESSGSMNSGSAEQPSQSGSPSTGSFDANPSPKTQTIDDEQVRQNKKRDRTQRMFMVVEQSQWVKKIRPKLFLR